MRFRNRTIRWVAAAGEYTLVNAALSITTGVAAGLDSNCGESGRTEEGCEPTLAVTGAGAAAVLRLGLAITFAGGGLLLGARTRRRTA